MAPTWPSSVGEMDWASDYHVVEALRPQGTTQKDTH